MKYIVFFVGLVNCGNHFVHFKGGGNNQPQQLKTRRTEEVKHLTSKADDKSESRKYAIFIAGGWTNDSGKPRFIRLPARGKPA